MFKKQNQVRFPSSSRQNAKFLGKHHNSALEMRSQSISPPPALSPDLPTACKPRFYATTSLVQLDTEAEAELSSTTRRRLQIRHIPVPQSKYNAVWRRVRAKLRSQLSLGRLKKDLNLFGTSLVLENDDNILFSMHRIEPQSSSRSHHSVQKESQLPWYLLHPDCGFLRGWSLVTSLLLLYTATIMPYRLAFAEGMEQGSWLYLEYSVNGLFALDLALNCFSAVYSPEGDLVSSLRAVLWGYAKGWMVIDLVACFPFNLVDSSGNMTNSSGSGYNGLVRLVRVPRLYRLLRLSRLFKALKSSDGCMSRLQDYFALKNSALRLFSFFISVLGAVHLMACLWCFAPSLEGYSLDSWIVRFGFIDSEDSAIYLAAFYWAFTTLTTVGYGDITAISPLERIIAVFWMLLGICSFSFTIGSLTNMIAKLDTKESHLLRKLEHIDEFCKETRLSKDLRTRLRHALRYSSDHLGYSWRHKHQLFAELPKRLKMQVAMAMYQGAVQEIRFFTERNEEFIACTVPFLLPLFVAEGEYVYRRNEHPADMFFIAKGRCAVTMTHKIQVIQLRLVQCGAYFGEIELLESIPRQYSVQTTADCDLLTLAKPVLKDIEGDFPRVFEEIRQIARTRKELYKELEREFFESVKVGRRFSLPALLSQDFPLEVEAEMGRRRSLRVNIPISALVQQQSHTKTELMRAVSATTDTLRTLETQIAEIKGQIQSQQCQFGRSQTHPPLPTRPILKHAAL